MHDAVTFSLVFGFGLLLSIGGIYLWFRERRRVLPIVMGFLGLALVLIAPNLWVRLEVSSSSGTAEQIPLDGMVSATPLPDEPGE